MVTSDSPSNPLSMVVSEWEVISAESNKTSPESSFHDDGKRQGQEALEDIAGEKPCVTLAGAASLQGAEMTLNPAN